MENSPPNLLDHKQLDVLILFGSDAYHDLIADVIADVPQHLAGIHAAIVDANRPDLRARAHSCRGMLSNFGCVAMTARLGQFEHDPQPPVTAATDIHAELEHIWQSTLTALQEWEQSVPEFT